MLRVTIEPFVALAILDHHMRRPDTEPPTERVNGIVLGATVKDEVMVRNFVPSMDHAFVQLAQRSCPNDLAVGWYSTGFQPADKETHSTLQKTLPRPVLISVHIPTEQDPEVRFRAFIQQSVQLSEDEPAGCFREIPCSVEARDNATNVLIDTTVMQLFPEDAAASDPARVPTTTASNESFAELCKISSNLREALRYVDDVLAGKRAADKNVGRALTELLVTNRVACADGSVVEDKMQDALMLQYIAKLLGQQLTVLQRSAPMLTRPHH